MEHHIKSIPNWNTPVVIEADVLKSDALGPVAEAVENEIDQGIVTKQNYALKLEPDPILHSLIEAIRDKDTEVWLELTLEQLPDIPMPAGKRITDQRKNHLVYWGRMIRNEAKGHVDDQDFTTPLMKNAGAEMHLGEFSCSFQNWFTVICSRPAAPFLDYFISLYDISVDTKEHMSVLFYRLIEYMCPTSLFAVSDDRLVNFDSGVSFVTDHPRSISHCNFLLHYIVRDENFTVSATDLWGVLFDLCEGNLLRPLFLKDAPVSLYKKWATLGEAIKTLSRDFRYKFQSELPTFEDYHYYITHSWQRQNQYSERMRYWAACARWLFIPLHTAPLKLALPKMTVVQGSIDWTPAALFAKKITITEPQFQVKLYPLTMVPQYRYSFRDPEPHSAIDYGDVHHLEYPSDEPWNDHTNDPDFSSSDESGSEITWETIFSLKRRILVWDANISDIVFLDADGGNSLTVWDDSSGAIITAPGAVVQGWDPKSATNTAYSWSQFHWAIETQQWGSCRALLEFEVEGVGIAPFGSLVKASGLLDWSDFPIQRIFNASPGILYGKNPANAHPIYGEYSVIDISRLEGGNTKFRAIELRTLESINFKVQDDPPSIPPPPDPPEITPPTTITDLEPLCGVVNFIFGIAYGGDVCGVSATVDGLPVGAIVIGTGTNITGVSIIVDACALLIGPHIICITVTPCDGPPVSDCWGFTVNHTCCGTAGSKDIHI